MSQYKNVTYCTFNMKAFRTSLFDNMYSYNYTNFNLLIDYIKVLKNLFNHLINLNIIILEISQKLAL